MGIVSLFPRKENKDDNKLGKISKLKLNYVLIIALSIAIR